MAVVYFLHVTVFKHFGQGPLWDTVVLTTKDRCLDRAASFFVYYQNYLDYNVVVSTYTTVLGCNLIL